MADFNRTAVWWIRRDLRLADNQALSAALAHSSQLIPFFILDPNLLSSPFVGPKRLAFLFEGLRSLDKALQARGSRLIVRRGKPLDEMAALLAETNAAAIFAEADFSPYARKRDAEILSILPLEITEGVVVHPPGSVLKANGDPYTVFTPFSKAWKNLPPPQRSDLLPVPDHIKTPDGIHSLEIPNCSQPGERPLFQAGSEQSQAHLQAFVSGEDKPLYHYGRQRNNLDSAGTSRLSPYLRFGMVSVRQTAVAALAAITEAPDDESRKSAESWLNELIWREFYVHILFHFPQVRSRSFRANLENIPWSNNETDFQAWCQGQTGYPIVDAAMRQLRQQGWMHNRARMVVASFLVKDLLVDWRWGERWFMQQLIDGDPAANNGGWQWTAGTGTDAAPYFRLFNPVLQGQKFDPDGRFVRQWLPELAGVPNKFIHSPWKMSESEQKKAGCLIGRDYPVPIIDHSQARKRTLKAYDFAKESDLIR